jgi:hypothetical protein
VTPLHLVLLVAESLLASIVAGAALVWFYNHFLSGMRESHVKKAAALGTLPLAVVAGVAHGLAIYWEFPRFAAIPWIGGGAILARQILVRRRQGMLNAAWIKEPLTIAEPGIRWKSLPLPAQLILRVLGPINEVDRPQLLRREVPVEGLHPDLDGYKLVFLTDFHVHRWMRPAWYDAVVEASLSRNPDLVLLGGDFVSRRYCRRMAQDALRRLSEEPIIAVRGNHDFWTDSRFFSKLVESWGGKVLTNDTYMVERGAGRLLIVGLEDPYVPATPTRLSQLRNRVLAAGCPAIGLVHTPVAYPLAQHVGCTLALAGHTHGGQIRLPFFGTTVCSCPGKPEHLWGAGVAGRMETLTSNGIGAFYPLRFLCPPQVVEIVLRVSVPQSSR